ncbi:hypothetical protein D3C87_347290 [compost metagenome]
MKRISHTLLFSAICLALSSPAIASKYVLNFQAEGVVPQSVEPPIGEQGSIAQFTLSKAVFSPTEEIAVNWSVKGNPSKVTITGLGSVETSGSRTLVLGDIDDITLSAQFKEGVKSQTIATYRPERIESFGLSKTEFSVTEPVTVSWKVLGKPSKVTITGLGVVEASGSRTVVLGDISDIVLTALFKDGPKSEVISTTRPESEEIESFALSKTIFMPMEPVTVTWNVTGKPDSVTISGIGPVPAAGSQTLALGDIYNITLTANYKSGAKTKVIPTSASLKPVSCMDIKLRSPNAASGSYTIDPDGQAGVDSPYDVYCDMEFAGGGWSLVDVSPANGQKSLKQFANLAHISTEIAYGGYSGSNAQVMSAMQYGYRFTIPSPSTVHFDRALTSSANVVQISDNQKFGTLMSRMSFAPAYYIDKYSMAYSFSSNSIYGATNVKALSDYSPTSFGNGDRYDGYGMTLANGAYGNTGYFYTFMR